MKESQPAADVNRVIRFGDLKLLQDVVGWFIFLCFLVFSYPPCSVFLSTPLLLTGSPSAYQGQYLTSSPSHTHCILTSVFWFFMGNFLFFFFLFFCLPSSASSPQPASPHLDFACSLCLLVFSLLPSHLKRVFDSCAEL